MKKIVMLAAALAATSAMAPAASAQSSARKQQASKQAEIPVCTRKLGTIAIVDPENQWWREFNLGSPEAIIKIFVQKSGCFTLVNRGRSLANRNMERALADSGELQARSNIGKGQVKAADYFLQPDIVSSNSNAGGNSFGGLVGGLMGNRTLGALAGGLSIKKKEANVTLSVVNARTTEEEALVEGYARKQDLGFGGSAGLFSGGVFGAGAGGYENTEIGQVIVLAYLDAYTKLVGQLGGLPANASAAAPKATR